MNPHRFPIIASSILLIFILAACTPGSTSTPIVSTGSTAVPPIQPGNASASGQCTNDYYPVSSGASWSYSSSGNVLGAYTYTQMITAVSETDFTTRRQFSTGVDSTFKWNCQDGNLAALDAGNNSFGMTTSSVTMTSTSVTADGYNIPSSFATGKTWSEKVTVVGDVKNNSTSKVVTSQIASQLNCTAAGIESVTVPAGTFDTVKVTCSKTVGVSEIVQGTAMPAGAPSTANVTYWYAKGVGLVQSVSIGSTSGTETIVLTQYKIK